jgi:hypothetical protein
MLACCGRPAAAAFGDPFPYIVPGYARKRSPLVFIKLGRSLGVALATAIIGQSDSCANSRTFNLILKARLTKVSRFVQAAFLTVRRY